MCGWMDGWKDGWMMDEWVGVQMDRCVDGWVCGWMVDVWMDEYVCMYGLVNGHMEWKYGQVDGLMNGMLTDK